jgi:hypothetical protein
MYNFLYVRIVEFEISADELDHLLFLNFNNDLPDKGLRPVLQGALTVTKSYNLFLRSLSESLSLI